MLRHVFLEDLDLCFMASVPLAQVIARLQEKGWPIIEGPVLRTGAMHG
ncbi:hypothetical protein J2X56_001200 [Herbaspirillum sp. 1173]|nr:hypothetical protein [Herbaspirillum sp. 1173]